MLHKASLCSKSDVLLSYPPRRSLMRMFWFLDIQRPSVSISNQKISICLNTQHTDKEKAALPIKTEATGLEGTSNDHPGGFPAQGRINYTYVILFIRPPDPDGEKQMCFGAHSPFLSLKPLLCVALVQPSDTPVGLVRCLPANPAFLALPWLQRCYYRAC